MDAYERGKRAGRLEGYEMAKEKQSKKVSDIPLLEREQMRKAMLDMLEQKYNETHPNSFVPGKENEIDSR